MEIGRNLFLKFRNEPPLAAALLTICLFSVPVLISIFTRGYVLLPSGYTYSLIVNPIFGILAILLSFLLLFIFSYSPLIQLRFHSIFCPHIIRILLIFFYIGISWASFYVFNAKLNFINSLISDTTSAMLSAGGEMVEEKLLMSFFFGMSGCISYALIDKNDGFILKFLSFFTMVVIVLFYFFIGRREISLMTLCFLLLTRKDKISKVYMISVGLIAATLMLSVLALRLSMQESEKSLLASDSEELSPIAFSAYIIEHTPPDFFGSFVGVTPVRMKILHRTIASAYVMGESGYNDDANNPVLGIAGITYLYAFLVPIAMLIFLGTLIRSITYEFHRKRTPMLRLLVIYLTFKTVNLFRNGEFPITSIDMILFILLCFPALFLTFNKDTIKPNSYES